METNSLNFKRNRLLKFLLIASLALLLSWNTNYAQPAGDSTPDPEWKPLMEVTHIGYNKADSTRHSYQFYPMTEKAAPLNLEQSHQYAFLWDFGQGRWSLEAFPVMIFEHDVPDSVTLCVMPLKQVGGPIRRLVIPRESNCDGINTIKERVFLRRGRIKRDPVQPSIRLFDPGFSPVPGRCINYLVEITLPSACEMGTTVTIDGSALGVDPTVPNQLKIKNVTCSNMRVIRTGDASLKLLAGPASDVTYYALLECEVGPLASIKNKLRWLVNGVFDPQAPSNECQRRTVAQDNSFDLMGSLDPSHLFCLNTRPVHTGDTAYWHLEMSNDGSGPEDLITITFPMPNSADLLGLHAIGCLWNGQPFEPEEVHKRDSITWYLNPREFGPLQPGEKVDLIFRTVVSAHWDCSKHRCKTCETEASAYLKHSVHVNFSQDRANHAPRIATVSNEELRLLCDKEKLRKIKLGNAKRIWFMGITAATLGVAATAVVIERVEHAKGKGKRQTTDSGK